MVILTRTLLKQIPKGAAYGLYAGKGVMNSVKVTFSNKKSVTSVDLDYYMYKKHCNIVCINTIIYNIYI